ncbi:FHA domain-containing protein [Candidatus Sumerlaeota bacterium]|nr:FHA domain-containing protein [Candidatus Sumerlaeota bacterium]
MAHKIRLVAYEGIEKGTEYVITDKASVGRGDECEIQLDHLSISRKHAEVYMKDHVFYFRDLGSTNGVFHNNKRVKEGDLVHGDRLRFGDVDFDVAEDSKPIKERADDDLLPGKRRGPKKKMNPKQRMRMLMMLGVIMMGALFGMAIWQKYTNKIHESPIDWKLQEQPFFSSEYGFELQLPADEGWQDAMDLHVTRRDWETHPPEIANGMIFGNELFNGRHTHFWFKDYFGRREYRVTLLVEVLEGVSQESDIKSYSVLKEDFPKYFNQIIQKISTLKEITGMDWASGGIGEEIQGSFIGSTGDKIVTRERGYCAFGNRYTITILCSEKTYQRLQEKESVDRLLDTFRAKRPEHAIEDMTTAEITSKAKRSYQLGLVHARRPEDKRNLYKGYRLFRQAVLLYKRLEEAPYEADQAMKQLIEVQRILQEHFETYRRDIQIMDDRNSYKPALESCESLMDIVSDEDEDWNQWAHYKYEYFKKQQYIGDQESLR